MINSEALDILYEISQGCVSWVDGTIDKVNFINAVISVLEVKKREIVQVDITRDLPNVFHGIPLTPNMTLEDRKEDDDVFSLNIGLDRILHFEECENDDGEVIEVSLEWLGKNIYLTTIKCVHQLQNLISALTGEELEIKM